MSQELLRQRLLVAFDLFEAGVDLKRQQLKRQHPDETDQQIAERIGAWLQERPGAEHGDAEGRLGSWPRRRS